MTTNQIPAIGASEVMNRREAIIKMALLMGGTMVGPRLLSSAWGADLQKGDLVGRGSIKADFGFSADDIALMDEVGETIIPATEIPGAKAVNIGAFMAMMVHDCYAPRDQEIFHRGLSELAAGFAAKHGQPFANGTPAQRTAFLNALDQEQRTFYAQRTAAPLTDDPAPPDTRPPHYFRVIKELVVLGYFSSEIGATQALRFIEVPGRFDGNAPYKKGDRAWF